MSDWIKIDQNINTDISAIISASSSVSSSNITITPPGNNFDYNLYTWSNKKEYGKNSIISVDINSSNNPQIQTRFTNTSNIGGIVYLNNSGVLTISEYIGSTQIVLNTGPGVFSGNFKLVSKSFENLICGLLVDTLGNVVSDTVKCASLNYANNTSTLNGLSCAGGPVTFSNYTFSRPDTFTNFLCIGDSNTAGDSGPNPPIATGNNWVQQLNSNYLLDPVYFSNCGTSGYTSYETLGSLSTTYIPRIVKYANNVAIIIIGTNDITNGYNHPYNQATTVSNYQTIVNTLSTLGVIVWVVSYPPRNDSTTLNTMLNKLNVAIKKSVKADRFIDGWSLFRDPVSSNESCQTSLLQSDGLHLNALGCTTLQNAIVTEITNSNILNNKGNNYSIHRGTNFFNGTNYLDKETITGNTTTGTKSTTIINYTLPTALLSGRTTSFVFNNPKILASSNVTSCIIGYSGAGIPGTYIKSQANGVCTIVIENSSNSGNNSVTGTVQLLVNIL